jgi:hypothetical protein
LYLWSTPQDDSIVSLIAADRRWSSWPPDVTIAAKMGPPNVEQVVMRIVASVDRAAPSLRRELMAVRPVVLVRHYHHHRLTIITFSILVSLRLIN